MLVARRFFLSHARCSSSVVGKACVRAPTSALGRPRARPPVRDFSIASWPWLSRLPIEFSTTSHIDCATAIQTHAGSERPAPGDKSRKPGLLIRQCSFVRVGFVTILGERLAVDLPHGRLAMCVGLRWRFYPLRLERIRQCYHRFGLFGARLQPVLRGLFRPHATMGSCPCRAASRRRRCRVRAASNGWGPGESRRTGARL
jgi:hypothetical protein